MQLHRLERINPASWGLYPEFEHRVREFLHVYSPSLGDEELFITELVTRWVQTPQLAGYWLVLDGEGILNTRVVGHVCSYIQVQYSKPYLFLYQLEVPENRGAETDELLKHLWFDEAGSWIAGLNESFKQAGAKQIDYVEQWSRHPAKSWKRRLPWLPQEKIIECIRWSVDNGVRE